MKKYSLFKDIYFSKSYVSLYLGTDDELFEFKYMKDGFIFYNISVKRPIKRILDYVINDGFFDLETAYGYGGFLADTDNEEFIKEAMSEYEKRCLEENIIAEFIRFHPFDDFPQKFSNFFEFLVHDRGIVYVDLSLSKEERWMKYTPDTAYGLRRWGKELIFRKSDDLDKFIQLYEKTMERNKADRRYYFPRIYYEQLINLKNVEIYEVVKDEKVISMGIFMFSDLFGHYHLGSSDYEMRKYYGNCFLLDQTFDVAKNKDNKIFILGGGRTGNQNDSLFKFKQRFSPLTKPFYIGGKIYNQEVYRRYTEIWEKKSGRHINYFLKYRLEA